MIATGTPGLVTPNLWAMAAVLLILVCGVVTASKGRWGWLLLGALVGGVIWPVTALLPASPGSVWRRVVVRRSSPGASSTG